MVLPSGHSTDWYETDVDLQAVGIPSGAFTVAGVSDALGDERLHRLIRKMPFTQRFHLCNRLEEAPGLFASSSVAVITNWRSELERRSCMQCLAAGAPILGADTGFIRQVVQTEVNGELLSVNDPELLADSIFQLYENRDRRAMLSAGARRSARQWSSMHQHLLQLRSAFEQVLTDGSAL